MPSKRTGYAPWSLTREAGVQSATVDGTIEVPQYLQPTIDTGFVDVKGNWKGRRSNDEQFIGITKAEGIPNSGEVLFPDAPNHPSIDMTGFNDILIALKPTNGGNYSFTAVMGPDTVPFANLSPVNSAVQLNAGYVGEPSDEGWYAILYDSSQAMTADAWNILALYGRAKGQKNMQFKVVNNSGGTSTMEFAFMRLV